MWGGMLAGLVLAGLAMAAWVFPAWWQGRRMARMAVCTQGRLPRMEAMPLWRLGLLLGLVLLLVPAVLVAA